MVHAAPAVGSSPASVERGAQPRGQARRRLGPPVERQVVVRDALVPHGPVAHDDVADVEPAHQRPGGPDPDDAGDPDRRQRFEDHGGGRGPDPEPPDHPDPPVGVVEGVEPEERGVPLAAGSERGHAARAEDVREQPGLVQQDDAGRRRVVVGQDAVVDPVAHEVGRLDERVVRMLALEVRVLHDGDATVGPRAARRGFRVW